MTTTLDGKWVWIWNWRRCEGGDIAKVAARLREAGCRGAIVKAHDGPRWFNQGQPWREIARALKAEGMLVGGWGYLYGEETSGEAQRIVETVTYGEADLFVLDVESHFEGRPERAEELGRRLREALVPDYPLYYSSFALPRYHRAFTYQTFERYCSGTAPQLYWNAFRRPVESALAQMYEDYAALGIAAERLFPVAGLYQEGAVSYPTPEAVHNFISAAAVRGSRGVSFWSYEHMNEAMWQAIAADTPTEEELNMAQYEEISARITGLENRVGVLESRLAQPAPPPAPPAPPAERYHIVGPEGVRGLWGVAEHLGLPMPEIPAWIAQVKALNGFAAENPIIQQGDRLRIP